MKAADLLAKALESEGVEFVFGVPGEENLDLLDSLARSKIRFVLTRHEQAAGFMAATVGRLTGNAGVCLSTLGPGATNLVTAAAYAQLGGMPMVMLTGQKPIKRGKQGQFQMIDVVDMMQPITKLTHQIVSGENVAFRVREAFRRAEEERPGAVHLELPEDVAAEETSGEPVAKSYVRRPIVEPKAVERAVKLLRQAKRPVLLIGAGANRKRTARMLRSFVDKHQIPFITTQMGKGVVDETHPLWLGNAALSDKDFLHHALNHADLILNVGHDVVEKPPFIMRSGRRWVVHINFSSASVDPVYFPQLELIGDIANTIEQLSERLSTPPEWDHAPLKKFRDALYAHLDEGVAAGRFPLAPQRIVADVRKVMPEDGIIALDNGMYKLWFARGYRARHSNTVLLDNALAAMGAGLPSAMAAKLIHPERKVVAICGDGGFMMNSQELETAIRLKLDLVVLIIRDGGLGMIKWKQTELKFREFGLDFDNPSFCKYAEAYRAQGHCVEGPDELAPRLQHGLQSGGVHLIEVPVDYSENNQILSDELPRRGNALRG